MRIYKGYRRPSRQPELEKCSTWNVVRSEVMFHVEHFVGAVMYVRFYIGDE